MPQKNTKDCSRKRVDYELLLQLNDSNNISSEISKNLNLLSGETITDENKYKEALERLEKQIK